VRGLGVATDLQVAELCWLAAHQPAVTRYATSQRNEGSHRLGARHGFELLTKFLSWNWKDASKPDGGDDDDSTGFEEATRTDLNRRRAALLERLKADGLAVSQPAAESWWRRVQSEPRFVASRNLYERRSWTEQELTEAAFSRHVDAGEVIALEGGGWGVAIVTRAAEPAEDAAINLAVIVGDDAGLARLAQRIQQAAGEPIRFRLEADNAGDELTARLHAAGFEAWEWELHILGRPGPTSPPEVDPTRLILTDAPGAVIRPPD
jgi:hypothetical protein